jgi:hypothetical protein
MNQVEALTALSKTIQKCEKTHELFPPDTDSGDWELIYDTRISVTWEIHKGFRWNGPKFKISLLHGRNDQITLGYYNLEDCLTVLKSATL